MTRAELLEFHKGLCSHSRELMIDKNNDYAGTDSPFMNLEMVEHLTRKVVSTEMGIVVRLADKLSRLAQAFSGELKVKDESVSDTIRDVINYAVLLEAKQEERRRSK